MKKLLKYDLKAVFRLWWIIAIASVCLSILGGLSLRYAIGLLEGEDAPLVAILLLLFGIVSIVLVAAGSLGTTFLTHARFYKNLFTDEGYLTFTLPLKRSSILFAKTLNSTIWQLSHFLLLIICAIIYLLSLSGLDLLGGVNISEIFGAFDELALFSKAPFFTATVIFELILFLISTSIFSTCLIQLCITIGSIIAKKSKVIVAVVIYIVATNVIGAITQLLTLFGSFILSAGIVELSDTISAADGRALLSIGMAIAFVIVSTFTVIVYAITQNLIDHKLNLA